jgi:sugar phosphate isomerase/epimerase
MSWDVAERTPETAEMILGLCEKYDVSISNLWSGWTPYPQYAPNMYEGWGLVPDTFRERRVGELIQAANWAKTIGVTDVTTHCGFIPENPYDPLYNRFLYALKTVLLTIKANGQFFNFETGQETAMTLLRTIEDAGGENLGVNLDTANFILYGKGHPVDALDMIGKYVRGLHCKDGFFPTTGRKLGQEVALGKGKANIPEVVRKLNELGYKGAFTIEREIPQSEEKDNDIRNAIALLKTEISKYEW